MRQEYKLLQEVYFKLPSGREGYASSSGPPLTPKELRTRLMQLKKAGVLSLDILLLLLRFSKLILNPNDISPIFKGRTFREHQSFKIALKTFYDDPQTRELLETRYLAPGPYNLQELLTLPEGSLGKVYAEHMLANKLEVVFYPPLEDQVEDDIAYLRKRARQTHDIHHVVLGLPAVDIGEMAISAFYLAQHNVPLSALLLGVGFIYTILREPTRIEELVNALMIGWNLGKSTPKVMGIKWEEYFAQPIEEVRQMLGIQVTPL